MFLRKSGNNFGNGSHGRKNHYINSRVGVNPKQVLVKNRVATKCRIEYSYSEKTFESNQNKRDSNNRCGKQLNPGCAVKGPHKQGKFTPLQTRAAHPVDG